jgi:hypothetical protein
VNSTGSSSPQGTGRFRAAGFVLGFAAVGLTLAYSAFAQQTGGAPTPPPTSRPTTQPGKFAPPGTPLTETKPLPAFWKSSLDDIDQCLTQAHKGKVELLCRSAGGRKLYVVSYGPPRNLDSQANYNSACGGGNPAWYVHKPAGTPPTVLLLGPVHGQEVEGIAGLMNLLHLVETGADLRGKSYPKLMESFLRCRVLIVPSGNPDGRSRVPLNGFIGESIDTNSYYGMGTNAAGKLWQWPQVKGHQPLTDVGYLGGYFNDAGVNLMHDDWFGRDPGHFGLGEARGHRLWRFAALARGQSAVHADRLHGSRLPGKGHRHFRAPLAAVRGGERAGKPDSPRGARGACAGQ